MSDTPDRPSEDLPTGGVLRPFVEPEQAPLPPVEPPVAPPVESDAATPDPPVEQAATTAESAVATVAPEAVSAEPMAVSRSSATATEAEPTTEIPVTEDRSDTEPSVADRSDSDPSDRDEPVSDPPSRDPQVADAAAAAGPFVIGRKLFLGGLGLLVAAIIVLLVLWQSAGGDDGGVVTATDSVPDSTSGTADTGGSGDAGGTDDQGSVLADETARADIAEQRAAELEGQVAALAEELAAQPIPALPASALQRVIIGTDAQFISATDVSVAVVGQFGGYANIDPATNAVTAAGQIAAEATRVMRTPTTVWATNFAGDEIVRLDPVVSQVVDSIGFPGPDGLAKDGGTLLVASFSEGIVARIDPTARTIVQEADVGGSATAVAAAEGRVYAAVFDTGEVVKIDPETFTVIDRVIVGAGPIGLALGDGDVVWVSNRNEGTVARVDFATGEVTSIPVGEGPVEIARAFGSLWVALADAGDLVQISLEDRSIVTRTPLGGSPTGLSVGAGSLWVAVSGDRSVVRVTPA